MRTAIYLRTSSHEQKKGQGIEIQKERCMGQAVAKGWEVTHTFIDEGVSGTLKARERPEMAGLIAAIEAGEIDAVIVAAMDRLARDAQILLNIVRDDFTPNGVAFVSCKDAIDTSSSSGKFFLTMLAGFAEMEKDRLVERLTDGRDARQMRDGERGGPLPLGYSRNGNGVEVDQSEAAIVRDIFQMRQDGAILQSIADALNDQGITSKQGGNWYPSTVRQILGQEDKYRGGFRKLSPVYWPEILD